MDQDRLYDAAARASAEIVNLYLTPGTCKSIQFQSVLGVVLGAMRVAVAELREELFTPSRN